MGAGIETALHAAAETGQAATARTLLDLGADANATTQGTDASGEVPVQYAAGAGHTGIVGLLVEQGRAGRHAGAVDVDVARTPLRRLWRGAAPPDEWPPGFREDAPPPAWGDMTKAQLEPFRGVLRDVCLAIAGARPDVGYCQGMDYVAAYCLRGAAFDPYPAAGGSLRDLQQALFLMDPCGFGMGLRDGRLHLHVDWDKALGRRSWGY